MILRSGSIGAAVGDLQRRLFTAGYAVDQNNIYDEKTERAVRQLQARSRLVVDGIYGPKSDAALRGQETGYLLRHSDILDAASTLGVDVASVLAVNEVESAGSGFVKPGAPRILFERHIFWRRLRDHGVDPSPLARKYPGVVSQTRGGYAGGVSEYTRLSVARQICEPAAYESASWGAFQIMGLHWQRLGYQNVQEMVADASLSEGAQLGQFVRFILADEALHKALKARKWASFARIYNGPAYAENLYDVKLARAHARHAGFIEAAA